jgi:hypothetical protein
MPFIDCITNFTVKRYLLLNFTLIAKIRKMSTSQNKKSLKQYVPTAEFYNSQIMTVGGIFYFTVDTDLNINSWNSGD